MDDEKIVHRRPPRQPLLAYLGYLGFAAQLPWTVILVYLPILETVLGGPTFAYTVSIAMGLACNIIRLIVVFHGRRFTFLKRVVLGSVCSSLFTAGYFFIYLFSDPVDDWPAPHTSLCFWLGLIVALIGGAGNAQLMSTGYGAASLVSHEKPVANTLFFFGQALASSFCWPLKRAVEALVPTTTTQVGISMCALSLVSLSILPVYLFRISRYSALKGATGPESGAPLKWVDAKRIFRSTMFPITCLWMSYFCTNLVTPGQLMQWGVPEDQHESELLTDPKLYRSLCSYVHLLSDAVSKAVAVFIALRRDRMQRILDSRATPYVMVTLVAIRICLLPMFYLPPASAEGRFVLLAMFGGINGIIASLSISLCSSRVVLSDTDVAGYLSSFTIINGLFAGSLAGLLAKILS